MTIVSEPEPDPNEDADDDGYTAGVAVKVYANGDRYEGPIVCDKRVGWDKCFYANGDVYEGEWEDDTRHGDGTCWYVHARRPGGRSQCLLR